MPKVGRALYNLENDHMGVFVGPINAGQIAVGAALGYFALRLASRN
ncbi:MAG: hypothetical protein QMB16_06445 [Paracoccaceae bacterium]